MSLSPTRIRLAADEKKFTDMVDQFTGAAPNSWRGAELDIEVGLFANGTILDSVTGLVSVTMDVLSFRGSSEGVLLTKTISSGFTNCTAGQWADMTGYHCKFALSSADTNFDLSGAQEFKKQFWLVISCVYDTNKLKTNGGTSWMIWEDSAQLGLPVIGTTNPNWSVGSNQILYIKDVATGGFRKIWFENGVLKCGESET